MKFYLFSFLLFAFPWMVEAQSVVQDADAEQRTVSEPFSEISISSGIFVYLTQSNTQAVAVSASEQKYRDRIITQVVNGKLTIYFDRKGAGWSGKKDLKVYVSFTDLKALKANSGAHVRLLESASLKDLSLDFSSGAHGDLFFQAQSVTAELSSGAQLIAKGNAQRLEAEASSGALFKGYDLKAVDVKARTNSGAGIRIHVTGELVAKATSGGAIRYQGTPVMKEVDVNSGGVIKRAD